MMLPSTSVHRTYTSSLGVTYKVYAMHQVMGRRESAFAQLKMFKLMQKVALHWIAKTHQLFSPDAPDDKTLITSLLMPLHSHK